MSNKKYKLVKCFPGSPPIGTIVRQRSIGYQSDGGYGSFFNEDIENYPEFWREMKEPILTTEDGVSLYQNDIFWHVDTYFCVNKGILATTPKVFQPIKGYRHFSTEEAAKAWAEMNKPQFSKKDLLDASINMQYGGWFIDGLIKRINK